MVYRELKKNGVSVSLLGYGCMRFPTDINGRIDEAEAEKLLDLAYSRGINYFDTAYNYHSGQSELFVGRVLSKYDRGSYYIADKLPCWQVKIWMTRSRRSMNSSRGCRRLYRFLSSPHAEQKLMGQDGAPWRSGIFRQLKNRAK